MTANIDPLENRPAPYNNAVLSDDVQVFSHVWLIYFNQLSLILKNLQDQIDDLQAQIDAL